MIGLRFTAAALVAGVEPRVTAHSGRVGLASEHARTRSWKDCGREARPYSLRIALEWREHYRLPSIMDTEHGSYSVDPMNVNDSPSIAKQE